MKSYAQRHPFLSMLCFSLMLSLGTFNTYALTEGDYTYTVTNGMATITEFNKSFSGTLVVADSLGGHPVVSFGDGSFSDCDGLTTVTIQEGVSNIGNWVFSGCDVLTSVTIPTSVTNVGDGAFSDCTALPEIAIPSSVTSIANFTFCGCDNLRSMTILPTVVGIGEFAFSDCVALTNLIVNEGVSNIKNWAFSGCRGLNSVTTPFSMTNVGNFAFSDCSCLTNAVIQGNGASIGEFAFSDCTGLTSVDLGEGVTGIGRFAFYQCYALAYASIKGNGASIGQFAFGDCRSLAHLTLQEGVADIGDDAFYGCESLASVTIPSSVTSIGKGAFDFCIALNRVIILSGLTSIGDNAFCDCIGLTSITIPSSVTYVGQAAFAGCCNLATVSFWGNAPLAGSYMFGGAPATIYYLPERTEWTNPWAERPTVCDARLFVPIIIEQPTDQSAVVGSSASFSVLATSELSMTYQWRKDGNNITGANNVTLTIDNVRDSDLGRYSVCVSNAYGSVASSVADLVPLGGWVCEQDLNLSVNPDVPQKEPYEDSLVIVTHGWHKKWIWQTEPDPNYYTWVPEMTDAIRQLLALEGKTNWRVEPYYWITNAWTELPFQARANADTPGDRLGARVGHQHWAHVHLIAHSAGCALIQAAAEKIKEIDPSTVVHTTFLDPYVGITSSGRGQYGDLSDWSDSYYAFDTTDYISSGSLLDAHNVDVTDIDPEKHEITCYSSLDNAGPISERTVAYSSHGWPHDFYQSTIQLYCDPEHRGYGFPLSKEGDGWERRGAYPKNVVEELGSSSACLPPVRLMPTYTAPSFNLNQIPYARGDAGTTVFQNSFNLSSFLPVLTPQRLFADLSSQASSTSWIAMAIPVTNSANYLSFIATFSSPTNAEGLLTVFWNTNAIGSVEERASKAGIQEYRFPLPDTYTEGLYSLTFRLDSFNSVTSEVSVANIALGFVGSTEPFALNIGADTAAGTTMTLAGASGYNYLVEASTNLVDWSLFAILANTNGAVWFSDPDAANYSKRFYRAVRP